MTAKQLYQAGKLNEAIQALGAEVRDNPTDAKRRTFLFELLCFAGEYDRAEKHLNVLAGDNSKTELGAILYHSALHASRLRDKQFNNPEASTAESEQSFGGMLNGTPFTSIVDADPRLGARLEVFAAGAYLWIPFEHIVAIRTDAPSKLRDLLWLPARIQTGPAFKGKELGEVLIPVVYPFSHRHESDNVKLGRETHFEESPTGDIIPKGQKVFLVDGEEFPLLDMRELEFSAGEATAA